MDFKPTSDPWVTLVSYEGEELPYIKPTATTELGVEVHDRFKQTVEDVVQSSPAQVVADLSEISYMDSSGLGQLLTLFRGLNEHDARLVIIPSEHVNYILELTRINKIIDTTSTLEEALGLLFAPQNPP